MEKPIKPNIMFHPIISSIQKIALYETKFCFYLMGSNNTQTRFRVLQIDRMSPRELIVHDDKREYTSEEIKDLVNKIDIGNRSRMGQRSNTGGVSRVVSAFGIIGKLNHEPTTTCEATNEEPQKQESQATQHKPTQTRFTWKTVWQRDSFPRLVPAFGLLGFVRFLEGYYIILVTKRCRVAVIGHHTLYKTEDTAMIYIPNDTVRLFHPDEQRYVKMFQNIDLSSNFYFSYSYDLTQTLQFNMAPPRHIKSDIPTANPENKSEADDVEDSEDFFNMWAFRENPETSEFDHKIVNYGVRSNPNRRFVWNSHLLLPVEKYLHPDWILYITHGFIGQSNISIFGRSMYVTIIARRSTKYAGTRFLKRGANFDGDVANEVETEQIVHDSGISSFSHGHFSSFVQMRGSVPGHWRQDVSKMVPKPTITCDLTDPYVETAGAHFNQLLKRYGSPIIILNLVKKREKKKHESTLSEELSMAVRYLNQFLPPEHIIQYISFDMARKNKGKEANVMGRLANIAHSAVLKTGIFQSQNPYYSQRNLFSTANSNKKPHRNDLNSTLSGMTRNDSKTTLSLSLPRISSTGQFTSDRDSNSKASEGLEKSEIYSIENKVRQCFMRRGTLQTGIIRTNCVDCLDRTNTAQFAIGKCALGFQLCALGVLETPKLEFDSDCVRLLEELYEDHGDTLALQYGGSQLVHRIKTYRKTAPWTSQGNDIMQTLSRYFSNTFSDQEKQHTINLFLGLFVPEEGKTPLWELVTDYYLHHKPACKYTRRTKVLTQWWDKNVLKCLPYALNEVTKSCSEMIQLQHTQEEMVDVYYDYHRPHELSVLVDVYAYKISHSVRDFMPNFTTNFSPFAVRVRPGRRREETGNKNANMKNPSMTGQSSTSSTASSASSSLDSSSDDDESHQNANDSQLTASKDSSDLVSFESLFPTMREVYGTQPESPKRADILLYKRYVLIGRNATYPTDHSKIRSKLVQQASFPECLNAKVSLPVVKDASISIYGQYVRRAKIGGSMPNPNDMILYENYVQEQMLTRRNGVCRSS
ncbi:polyphosphoinositide phosphatase isoform X2 [Neodiprion fabricii]|uniref:polyphosphoinositide phosphatase isoform X2 n=1 Tax=Neodiprion fabricii TaxID=2872261 RepID=UPI001ED8F60C|nr:polyphosphoinositide phosphatase isoform X2 [Neodiprion fabricii]